MRRALALTSVAVLALTTGVALGGGGDGVERFPVGPMGDGPAAAGGLLAVYEGCDALAADLTDRALEAWSGQQADVDGGSMASVDTMQQESEASAGGASFDTASSVATAAAPAEAARGGTTETNSAVVGIDEPDLVETDGRRVFSVVRGDQLQVVDVTAATPTMLARVPLGADGWHQLLLVGDRLLVIGQVWDMGVMADDIAGSSSVAGDARFAPHAGITRLRLFDVAGDAPVELASTDVEGQLVTARGVGPVVHLVSQSWPEAVTYETLDAAARADDPEAALAEAYADVESEAWLPHTAVTDIATGERQVAPMPCEAVQYEPGAPDQGLLSLHTFDVARDDLTPTGTSAIVSDGQAVTATADRLVVATTRWPDGGFGVPMPLVDPGMGAEVAETIVDDAPDAIAAPAPDDPQAPAPPPTGPHTVVHLFATSSTGATHLASGEVDGTLLNQFAMSWHADTLRIATTVEDSQAGTSVSQLAVLAQRGEALVQIGHVGELGPTEVIHAVRYLGDTAYVVTFRQTDPLYVIDLRDPTAPTVTGELKIPGYSAYLHPLPDGRLLGIGQDADAEGMTLGLQVSLFDVRDPTVPTRTAQLAFEPGTSSPAEWDHLAVTVHEGRLYLPFTRYGPGRELDTDGDGVVDQYVEDVDSGVAVIDAAGDTLTEVARMRVPSEDPYATEVARTLVVDGSPVLVNHAQLAVFGPDLALRGTVS